MRLCFLLRVTDHANAVTSILWVVHHDRCDSVTTHYESNSPGRRRFLTTLRVSDSRISGSISLSLDSHLSKRRMNEIGSCCARVHRRVPGNTRDRYSRERWMRRTSAKKKVGKIKRGSERIFVAIDNGDHVCGGGDGAWTTIVVVSRACVHHTHTHTVVSLLSPHAVSCETAAEGVEGSELVWMKLHSRGRFSRDVTIRDVSRSSFPALSDPATPMCLSREQ